MSPQRGSTPLCRREAFPKAIASGVLQGFASCHFISSHNKKAHPFPGGLWSVVVDVQERAAIGSRRLQQLAHRPDVVGNACFHRRRDAQLHVNPHQVVPGEMQAVCRPEVFPLLTEGVRQAREAAHTHADRQVLALDVRRTDLRRVGVAHDWDSLRVRHIGRAVPAALLCGRLAIDLDELREIATVYESN